MSMDAHTQIQAYCDRIRDRAAIFPDRLRTEFESLSDSIQTLAMAYILPEPENIEWRAHGLSRMQARFASILRAKLGKVVTREAIMNALYFDKMGDEPEPKIIDVLACQTRKKLKGLYTIEPAWGVGYVMEPVEALEAA